MAEYIEREAAIKAVCDSSAHTCDLKNCFHGCQEAQAILAIPAADVAHVVRCGECKHSAIDFEDRRYCKLVTYYNHVPDDWFCADGERKDGDGE